MFQLVQEFLRLGDVVEIHGRCIEVAIVGAPGHALHSGYVVKYKRLGFS